MAVFSEKDFAVKLFRNASDIFFQQFTNGDISEVYESIKNISPRNEGKLPYSRSLDQCSALISSGSNTKSVDASKQIDNKLKGDGRENGCKTITFKPANEKFVFEKCKEIQENNYESLLTEVVLNKMEKLLPMKVFFPKGKYDPPFVTIRAQETDTVQNVIENVIKQYNEITKGAQLPKGLKGYQLNTAEEDGSPDEFCLRMDQYITKMGSSMFALVINSDANIRMASFDRSPLVVWFPDNTKTLFQFQVNLKVSDIVRKVCERRALNYADFHLESSLGMLPSDLPIEDITVGAELQLCPNVSEKDEEGEISGSILSDHDAYKYKVFDVTYSRKKNYLLGVDEEHIQIFKKKGSQKDAAGKQREVRKVSDIQSVTVSGDKVFNITWNDLKVDIFESKQRKEIVEKIEYIQRRKKEQESF